MEESKINSNQFISVSLILAEQACKIIREIHNEGVFSTKFKVGDDPVTKADFTAQWIVETGLKKAFPGIKIIGEEGSNGIPSEFDFNNFDLNKFDDFGFEKRDYNLDDCCVFIDPLDGTRNYIKGELYAVSCLITLACNKIPVAAIIAKPFEGHAQDETQIYVGQLDTPKVIHIKNDPQSNKYMLLQTFGPFGHLEKDRLYSIFLSQNHANPLQNDFITCFPNGYEPVNTGGIGPKTIGIVSGKVDCLLYPTGGAGRWDTGPMTVMITALGGIVCDLKGNLYEYQFEGKHQNQYGLIAINTPSVVPELAAKFLTVLEKIGQHEGNIYGIGKDHFD